MNSHDNESDYEFLQSLNPQQRQAVTHGDSPLLIVAGAGTGKTTTLAHRVAWQIVAGIEPDRILLLTFSRRASTEMLRRVEGILRDINPDSLPIPRSVERATIRRIRGGTFHAVATALLRRHGQLIGLYPDFTILDRGDSEDLINMARGRLKLPAAPKGKKNSKKRFPLKGTCLDIYSRCVNTQMRLDGVLIKWFPWCLPHKDLLAQLFTMYAEFKEQQRVLDFDDLLLFWHALLQDENGQTVVREQFDRVLVDEYQDTNVLQAEILKLMVPDGAGLTAVGDDAQSIYSFRAATVRNILDFPNEFSTTQVVPLEQNYRSVQSILSATTALLAKPQNDTEKSFGQTEVKAIRLSWQLAATKTLSRILLSRRSWNKESRGCRCEIRRSCFVLRIRACLSKPLWLGTKFRFESLAVCVFSRPLISKTSCHL